MTRISSRFTQFHKRIFPTFWFGFVALFAATSFFSGAGDTDPMFYIGPAFMAVVGFAFMKKLVWDLADEVYDCGDELLVRNRGREERIRLSGIINVNVSSNMNPPRITLRLDRPGRLGGEVAFSPASDGFSLNPFARNRIGEDLIVRVDRARMKRAP